VEDKRNLNKSLFKVEIKLIKIIPFLLALIYFINTILSAFRINLYILSFIGYMSFIPLIFMYISSYVFQFCEYHRLPLHYIVLNNVLSIIGYNINFGTAWFWLVLHILLFGIVIIIVLYSHLKDKSI
jgi:hypothetical protein